MRFFCWNVQKQTSSLPRPDQMATCDGVSLRLCVCMYISAQLHCSSLIDAVIMLSDHSAVSCIFEERGASIAGRTHTHHGDTSDWRLSERRHPNAASRLFVGS